VTDSNQPPVANASGRQLLRNFVTSYLGLIVSLLLSLFLTPVVLRTLGSEDYGLWVVIVMAGGYVGFLGVGVETAAVRQIAAAIAVGDEDRLREIVGTVRLFFLVSGTLAGLVLLALVPFVGDLFNVRPELASAARVSMALMAVVTGVGMMVNIPATTLFGAGRTDNLALFTVGTAVASQGLQIVVVLVGGGFIGLFAVNAGQCVVSFLLMGRVTTASRIIPPGPTRATRAMFRELFRSGSQIFIVGLGSTLAYKLDAIIIGLILPAARVTPYDLGLSTASFTRSMSTAGTSILMPTYAHSSALDDRSRQFRLWSRSILLSLAITVPMASALVTFGQTLLHLWLGLVPPDSYEVMVVINVVFLLQLPGIQAFGLLTGAGRASFLARLTIGPSVATLALSVGATYWLGPVGPAVASLPQTVLLDFVALPVLCCRFLRVPIRQYVREALTPLVVPVLAAPAISLVLARTVGTSNELLAPIECVAVCVGTWMALAPVLFRRDEALKRFVGSLMRRGVSR